MCLKGAASNGLYMDPERQTGNYDTTKERKQRRRPRVSVFLSIQESTVGYMIKATFPNIRRKYGGGMGLFMMIHWNYDEETDPNGYGILVYPRTFNNDGG